LKGSSQVLDRFSYAAKTRRNLLYSFQANSELKFGTEKGKTHYTLLIHKTRNQYTRELQDWKNELSGMRLQLFSMDNDFMSVY
jgi:hypothetical protein